MDERRRELAFEGDNWFDFVRLADYDVAGATSKILAQERGYYGGDALKGVYGIDPIKYKTTINDITLTSIKLTQVISGAGDKKFRLPFPSSDVVANPNLGKDVQTYNFDGTVDYYKKENFAEL